jgi:hypothetical protein
MKKVKTLKNLLLFLILTTPALACACSSTQDLIISSYINPLLRNIILISLILSVIFFIIDRKKTKKKKLYRKIFRISLDILIICIALFAIISIWKYYNKQNESIKYDEERIKCIESCKDRNKCFCNPMNPICG